MANADFPTRNNCDPSNPDEAFLHMLVALPHMNGAQLVMPVEYLRLVSRRIWEQGGMVECESCGHTKAPKYDYVAPAANSPHWLTDPGRFVEAGQGAKVSLEGEIDASLERMGHRQKVELFKALQADEAGEPVPDTPAGEVVSRMPAPQKAAVLRRLRDST